MVLLRIFYGGGADFAPKQIAILVETRALFFSRERRSGAERLFFLEDCADLVPPGLYRLQ
uniref:Uncharacterized protein n=1 Tax=Anguilla anguilla TaxID=7936 RepID=A0A0E9V5T3_ANGAN